MSAVGPTIIFVAAGTFTSGTGALSVPPPAGILNKDLLLLLCQSANQVIALPTGWLEVGTQSSQAVGTASTALGTRLAVFYKFTTGTEANVAVADSGTVTTGQIFAFRGVNRKGPFNAITSGASLATGSTAVTMPSVTTTIPNSMIVLCLANDRSANNTNNFTANAVNANLTSITERGDATTNAGAGNGGGGTAMWTAYKTTVGATGTTTATNAAAVTYGYLTIALRPERRIIKAI